MTSRPLQTELPCDSNLADLLARVGDVSPERVRLVPPPGLASGDDVVEIHAREGRLYELDEGTLVEKAMGWYESLIAGVIFAEIRAFVRARRLGKVFPADGMLEILPGKIKIPDVSFVSWDRWPGPDLPRRPVPAVVPDLAVEVLSETNTESEMEDKLGKYFRAGVRLVWYVDPETRGAKIYTSPRDVVEIDEDGVLDGRDVLHGFEIPLRSVFEEADEQAPTDAR